MSSTIEQFKEEKSQQAIIINRLIKEYFDIHLVTCWNCWKIFNDKWQTGERVQCPHCDEYDERCHFPDLFY
jgi:hypothetical protein